jgi:hypothetical protein
LERLVRLAELAFGHGGQREYYVNLALSVISLANEIAPEIPTSTYSRLRVQAGTELGRATLGVMRGHAVVRVRSEGDICCQKFDG